jgi:hypothetical protein
MIVRRAMKNASVVAGGGAIDMEVSRYLREHARSIAGKSQLFMNAYAKVCRPLLNFEGPIETHPEPPDCAGFVRLATRRVYCVRRTCLNLHSPSSGMRCGGGSCLGSLRAIYLSGIL